MVPVPSPVALESSGPAAESGGVSLDHLKQANRRQLWTLLDVHKGSKALVWDPDLMKRFNLLASPTELRQRDISQMLQLQKGRPAMEGGAPVEHVVFLTRPTLHMAECIAECVRSARKDDKRQYHLIFVPRSSVICEQKLKEIGVSARFASVQDLPIFFYAWDRDLASMESPWMLRNCLLEDDWSSLYDVVAGIDAMESVFGRFSVVCCKGMKHKSRDWSERVLSLLEKKREQDAIAAGKCGSGEAVGGISRVPLIHSLILMDRWVDPLTPLVTQLTYEGLIDETFGITCATAKFPKERFSAEGQESSSSGTPGEKKQIYLNSTDELYAELRNLNFNAVGPTLSRRSKAISEQIDSRHSATTVREYKEFVKRLPELQAARQSAGLHVTIAELIKEATTSVPFLERLQCEQEVLNCVEPDKPAQYIEDAISKGEPAAKVLRLICLQVLASDGLKPKILDQYKRDFIQSYGHEHISTLVYLQKAGLLRERTTSIPRTLTLAYPGMGRAGGEVASFSSLRKAFRLIVEDVNEQVPNDVSYVYSGYAPLSARLCQYYVKPGWKSIMDTIKKVPGATAYQELGDTPPSSSGRGVEWGEGGEGTRTVLVVFLGGVTLAEVSAIRFLNTMDTPSQHSYSFLIGATHVINGDNLMDSFMAA